MASKLRKLYIGGLLQSVTKEDLTRELGKFGIVSDVWIARNPPGFAFVEFEKAIDAEKAVRALDGITVCDSMLRVEFARGRGKLVGRGPAPPKRRRPSSYNRRNGRSPSLRRRKPSPRRSHSPRFSLPLESQRYPYEQFASLYNPEMANAAAAAAAVSGYPYQVPMYPPMFPFMPTEDIMRGFQNQRHRTPPPPLPRPMSPGYRHRSRSPMRNSSSRVRGGRSIPPIYDDYDRREYGRIEHHPEHRRGSLSPNNRRHDLDRSRGGRDNGRRR